MPFGIDPRKIIEEDNQEEDKKVKEAIKKTLTFEEQIEENETTIRKRSDISKNFSEVDKALREVNFVEKEGMAAWRKEKENQIVTGKQS
jgi:phage-related minor tail protein